MAGRSKHSAVPSKAHNSAAVHGLDLGRDAARRSQRRRRRSNRLLTTVLTILLLAAVGGAGWLAYTAYVEHDGNEQVETDRRVAEIEQERIGRTTDDIINELQQTPAWNGPGNPTFGVGGDTANP
jgi:hypothetical protein